MKQVVSNIAGLPEKSPGAMQTTQVTASILASDISRLAIDTISVSNPAPNSPAATTLFWVR
jgi:hypothetical protein